MKLHEKNKLQIILIKLLENKIELNTCMNSIERLFNNINIKKHNNNIELILDHHTTNNIIEKIAKKYNVNKIRILSSSKSKSLLKARCEICEFLHECGFSNIDISKIINKHPNTISKLLKRK